MRSSNIPAVRDGDVVAICLEPSIEWRGLIEAVWEAGAALLPVDHRLLPTEIEELLALARPTVVVDAGEWRRLDGGLPAEPQVALVVATSGSGGRPKLVQLSRSAVDAAVAASALALEASPRDVWVCCLPLGHVGGLLVLLRSVLLGAPVAIQARFDPGAIASVRGGRFLSLVPTMLGRLLMEGIDLRGYGGVLVGGGALPPDVRRSAELSGARVIETYGLTESCGGVVYDGRPLPGVGVRLADGGVQLAGPTLMLGYRFDPEETAAALSDDGWLRTFDAGRFDAHGRLEVIGRMDDVIVTGGEKVWPAEIESVLREHPKIADVAVAGRPDPAWGSRVVAFVVPLDAATPPSLDEVRDHVAVRFPRFRAPRELVVLRELPRTPMGKLRRKRLPI